MRCRLIVASKELIKINSRNNRIGGSSELENEPLLDVFLVFFFFRWLRENLERLVAILLALNADRPPVDASFAHIAVAFFVFTRAAHVCDRSSIALASPRVPLDDPARDLVRTLRLPKRARHASRDR